jgi:hypothetical protein
LVYNRKAIAPWSTERSQGIESATVDSNIETPQYLQPTVNTGVIDLAGNWIGNITSDKLFRGFTLAEGIPNGAVALFPDTNNFPSIDMTGFNDIFIAIKNSSGSTFGIQAVMGPDSLPFANLTPVNPATLIRIAAHNADSLNSAFSDTSEALSADVWNIFRIDSRLSNQKNLQFKVTNSSGGNSDIEFAFMRVV